MAELLHRTLLEMDQAIHAGALRVLPGRLKRRGVDVIALDIRLRLIVHALRRLVHGFVPAFARNQMVPVLSQEGTVHPRRDAGGHQRRFNGKCPASAKRIHQNPLPLPWGEQDQRRRQRLRDRGLHRCLAVAALMQGIPARIKRHRRLILMEKDAQRVFASRLRHPLHPVF